MEPNARLKALASQANSSVSCNKNAPLRRYYRSGLEMLRMGNVYFNEERHENAYVIYLRYLTLFVEKVRDHPEYKSFAGPEKTKVTQELRTVMDKSEKLKLILKLKYEKDFELWLRKEEERRLEHEEEQRRQQEEMERIRKEEVAKYQDEKEKAIAMQRDYEAALFHQIQADKEFEREQLEEAIKKSQQDQSSNHSDIPVPSAPAFDRGSKPSHQPQVDRSSKPAFHSSHGALRNILVPAMVMGKFLSAAQANTSKNIETCAILAGKLASDRFRITHILLPKQQGTADSCSASCEEDIFDYQDKHDLITLGWIHTHPSQTAFLSSVDLHTHLPYQLMLPEAIAIVCAPKHQETGFFVLTPHGLDFLGRCSEKGFHAHPKEPPLFDAGGHITVDNNADVTLVDFR